jgi:ATP adenylyltransferase
MEYIDSLSAPAGGCFLCHYREHPENDAEQLVVRRSKHAMVLLNRFPYSNGHMLITPLQHVGKLEDLDDNVLLELMQLTRDCKLVLEPAFNAQGFNVGINLGHCAGAGLPDHIHIHIVPPLGGRHELHGRDRRCEGDADGPGAQLREVFAGAGGAGAGLMIALGV